MGKLIDEEDCEVCTPFDQEWIFTYGDLVTLLLCFFILLFSTCKYQTMKFKSLAASFKPLPAGTPFMNEGKDSVVEQIAQQLEVSVDEVKETLLSGRSVRSLDASFQEDEEQSLLDVLPDDSQESPEMDVIRDCMRGQIENALSGLVNREAEIIRLYFGLKGEEPMTLDQIGSRFCLTRERVRQIKEKALLRLRHPSRSERLRAYSKV